MFRFHYISKSRKDFVWVCIIVSIAYLATLYFDLSDNFVQWARQYEASEVDELPFIFLITAIASTWYALRRMREVQAEMELRKEAEKKASKLLSENKALARHAIQLQEEERRHLYRELHDDLGQYLTAIRLDAVSIPKRGATAITQHGQRIAAHAEHIQKALRNIIHRMRPEALDAHGLKKAIRHMIQAWHQQHPDIACETFISDDVDCLSDDARLAVYRAVQESLTNIAKYAQSTHIRIFLNISLFPQQELVLSITDNGIGFSKERAFGKGFGLLSMRERVECLNGQLEIESQIGQGTKIEIKIPLLSQEAITRGKNN